MNVNTKNGNRKKKRSILNKMEPNYFFFFFLVLFLLFSFYHYFLYCSFLRFSFFFFGMHTTLISFPPFGVFHQAQLTRFGFLSLLNHWLHYTAVWFSLLSTRHPDLIHPELTLTMDSDDKDWGSAMRWGFVMVELKMSGWETFRLCACIFALELFRLRRNVSFGKGVPTTDPVPSHWPLCGLISVDCSYTNESANNGRYVST